MPNIEVLKNFKCLINKANISANKTAFGWKEDKILVINRRRFLLHLKVEKVAF